MTILLLTAAGLQGLAALVVRHRLSDIAIRIMLGATPRSVTGYAAGLALRPALWGLASGCICAFIVVRALSAMLFGLSGLEPVSLAAAAVVMVTALGIGIAGPLLGAVRVAPADVLRSQ